ncbi:MAG TPA: MotA/TolQ/ExbB proton channel family protein [Pseudobdellovibrionaceae bacterium]|nr:MotA/TolQ/ExbB proton channel family protein [Pseudobdellovibrionaceae bacterium]
MTAFLTFMNDSGIVGWFILLTGVGTLVLVAERARALFFHYGMNADEFMNRVQTLVLSRKLDEALVLCSQMESKPLAKAFKTILEKADRDDETIFQAHDIAMSEAVPLYTRRLHYLSMLANVATLLGLLGTIHGLIISFQAVAQADPAAKQHLLANGISVSMYTTALGLAVAIPAMVFYSFLVARQNGLVEQATEKCSKLTELLTSAHIPSLSKQAVFPDSMAAPVIQPPNPNSKVS